MGGAVWDWIKKGHNLIRNNKIISRIGNALGNAGVPYAGNIGKAAELLGYGRLNMSLGRGRKRLHHYKGGALRLAGSGRLY